MQWNDHSNLEGKHAVLAPSNYHWLNYDDEKLCTTWKNLRAKERGTQLHKWAEDLISSFNLTKRLYLIKTKGKRRLNIDIDAVRAYGEECQIVRESKAKETVFRFVADAMAFDMVPEQPLMFSWNCYGHADAISFDGRILRIHDLKTGETVAHMEQLQIYAALFCLEYHQDPNAIDIELRIYQSNNIVVMKADPQDIMDIMNNIVHKDSLIEGLKREEL